MDWEEIKAVGVIGLGRSGLSVVDFLLAQGKRVVGFEENSSSPSLSYLKKTFPQVELKTGALSEWHCATRFVDLDLLVVSPGIDCRQAFFTHWKSLGKPICGDVELFCRFSQSQIIAVSGSNGKSTVVTLIANSLVAIEESVSLAGNIGRPVLDLLKMPESKYTVLELSSFQLETISSLQGHVAVVVNYSPDHLDRYETYNDYVATKNRIYHRARASLVNVDQPECLPTQMGGDCITFSIEGEANYRLQNNGSEINLMRGNDVLCCDDALALKGPHHFQNALVVFAVMDALGKPIEGALTALAAFSGLSHRCEYVTTLHGVSWFNDSKATNEGATIAAIRSLRSQCSGNLVLIAGGDAKGGEFQELVSELQNSIAHVVLLGRDRDWMRKIFSPHVAVTMVESMQDAVKTASSIALAGDSVLLSPACSSLDMFDNFEHRGDVFTDCVQGLMI